MGKVLLKGNSSLSTLLALAAVSALVAVVLLSMPSVIFVFGSGSSNAIGGNIVVVGTCAPSPVNTLITFPTTQPGSFAPTANAENVVMLGASTSNIWVSGGNWANIPGPSPTFNVGNTLWSLTSGQNIGTALAGAAVDTKQPVVSGSGNGNVVFFGLNIPIGTAGGAYNQIITISSSC